jgi:ferric-dicitrate binding protein FerR (iron transport regulator)
MNAMTGNYLPAEMRASDSDRDAVVSDLSEHFQAGRLTAEEFDERTGRALPARTWGELGDLLADLPSTRLGPQAPANRSLRPRPRRSSGRFAPPPIAALAGIAIAAAVLVNVAHGGWGFIWLLLFGLFIARRLIRCAKTKTPRTQ